MTGLRVAMILRGALMMSVVVLFAAAGCDRPQPQAAPPVPAPSPAQPPATATAPATTTASTQPAGSVIHINNQRTIFPPARLRVESDGQHLVALLFTDDPKDALKDSYTGNSFYLRMELDVDDADKLAEARWHYTAPSSGDREDSPYGIYLGGRKVQLQPFDVWGAFKVDGENTFVQLSGQFQVVDESAGRGPPQLVLVAAVDLPVRVQTEPKKN